MKLRPRGSKPSFHGNEDSPTDLYRREYFGQDESSDDGNCTEASSDDDFVITSDEGETYFNVMEENGRAEVLDLNHQPEHECISSDHDSKHEAPKRRNTRQWNRRGKQIHKAVEEHIREVNLQQNNLLEEEGNSVDIGILGDNLVKKKNKRKRKGQEKHALMWEVWEKENERWIEDNLMNDVDLENQNDMIPETAEAPTNLIMPLLRYQKEWLAWAMKQEESPSRGGILADEMGMGKTVQAIALVCAKRELNRATGDPRMFSSVPSTSMEIPAIKATLVICPVVAVIQWVSEIDRFTTKGSNKVLVYHGANRGKSFHQFSEYDFVITTYSIVEAEYRKNVMPPKEKCQWCGKSLYAEKMPFHLRYFCGPAALRTAKQSKQHRKKSKLGEKLAKVDASQSQGTASDSENDKKKKSRRKMGKKHIKKDLDIEHSYSNENEVACEPTVSTKKSILHSFKWERIILDEAHYIKDRRCNTTRAVFALSSSYKWALSGTPLQNRVGELYSLVRFLQIVPHSYYFCKDCDCRTLDYSTTDCPTCPHKSVRHFCWWNRYIASPIQARGNTGTGRGAMLLLKHKILKSIVLRRTKKGRAADLALPPRIVSLRRDSFDITEADYYTSLYNETQAEFNTYVRAGTVMNNYAHIFDLLTRLRQAVDHPYLVVYSNSAVAASNKTAEASIYEQVCGLCHDPVEDHVVTSCGHLFCKSCLIDFSASVGQVSCPSCSKPLTVDFSTSNDKTEQSAKTTIKGFRPSSILNRIQLDNFQTSTKIEALREEIRFMIERDGSAKAIVFSQFTSFLDLIHYSLQKSGVNCVQLVGSMSLAARDAAIKKFTDDPDCRIFLMSLKAGGVALNLTMASNVFLMDPWWNPAVEQQAQDRIHRIGQYKPIRIVRFIIENTIEERILKLQTKKQLVFEGTVGGSSEALGKLTEADLRFLFVT